MIDLLPTSALKQEQKIRHDQPIIILGMHRSGTTLLSQILQSLDIHMGKWLSRDQEAVFFQKINRYIYKNAKSNWADIFHLSKMLDSKDFISNQVDFIEKYLFRNNHFYTPDAGIIQYFGISLWNKYCQGHSIDWGWKDPRNSLTFPIWSIIFPNARFVHIIRNGVDVAISMHQRSLRQNRKLRNRVLPFDFKPLTLDFSYCFQLWEKYITFIIDHQSIISPQQFYELRYENLLSHPVSELTQLFNFLGSKKNEFDFDNASVVINPSRLNNLNKTIIYRNEIKQIKASLLLQQLGYNYELG